MDEVETDDLGLMNMDLGDLRYAIVEAIERVDDWRIGKKIECCAHKNTDDDNYEIGIFHGMLSKSSSDF